ncbi:hypothetical protein [Gluconacetobacter takamatsuzukensis]|uniref:Uncharacterized protein n=1 Tax=Gluconacetobacter takamatsuzukensis TaxID=1286190 RepID=A0A7W4KG34_9PROT|nr:hypothetical protein [Gluconacetobacter takamatsuzukensis]MBB2206278.1 hypothetical protein [Gluconacetobacter takamatsuzukensis]
MAAGGGPGLYGRLAGLRLRWYGRVGRDLLARHWQWALLAGLLVPGTPVVGPFLEFSLLLGAVVAPGMGMAGHVGPAVVVDLAAMLWVLPQRRALAGGAFMTYVATLPVGRAVCLSVAATVLAVADGPLLLSAGVAAGRIGLLAGGAYPLCCFLVVLGLAGVAQHAVVIRRWVLLGPVVVGDVLAVAGLDVASPVGRWGLLGVALAGTVGLAGFGGRLAGMGGRRRARLPGRAAVVFDRAGFVTPALRVQWGILADRPVLSVLRIGTAVGLALGVARLVALFDFDTRAVPTLIVAVAAIGLLLAGLYRTLFDAHRAAAGYLATLPLPPRYWPLRDTGFLMLVNLVPLAILLRPQGRAGGGLLAVLAGLAVAGQGLLVLLRWPVLHGGRYRLVLSLLLAAGWSGAAMAAVSR